MERVKRVYSFLVKTLIWGFLVWFILLCLYAFIFKFQLIPTYFIVLPLSIVFTLYVGFPHWLKEPKDSLLGLLTNQKFYLSLNFIFIALIFYLFDPPSKINEWFLIIFGQAIPEELFFRFSAIGILRNRIFSNNKITKNGHAIVILLSALFAYLHGFFQQSFLAFLQRTLLGIICGYLFLELNIIPSIVFHASWNFYIPLPYKSLVALVIGLVIYIVWYVLTKKWKNPEVQNEISLKEE